jgi:hypothetical protein
MSIGVAVYGLLDRDTFTRADTEEALSRALGKAPVATVEQALLELRVFGFAVERDGRFAWAIPLLRETLLAAEPELAARRLVEELTENDGEELSSKSLPAAGTRSVAR